MVNAGGVSAGIRTAPASASASAAPAGVSAAAVGVSAAAVGVGIHAASAAMGENQLDRSPVDVAWLVLEAANDLGDEPTVEACRRIIDASLNGKPAPQADLILVTDYFR
jgi:hypothetical protein